MLQAMSRQRPVRRACVMRPLIRMLNPAFPGVPIAFPDRFAAWRAAKVIERSFDHNYTNLRTLENSGRQKPPTMAAREGQGTQLSSDDGKPNA
jgi:hypothetical protein